MLKTIMWYQLFFEQSIMTFIMSTISSPIYKKKLSQQEFKYLGVCFKFIKFIPRNIPWNIKMRILFRGI